jgi:hypothetical protein
MRPLLLLLLLLLSFLSCSRQSERVSTDVEEWRLVLHAKKAAVKADDPQTRQHYAETLLRFVQKHPDHARARQVYNELEIDLAHDLTEKGAYDQALRYLRDVEARDPKNRRLQRQLAETLDLQSVDSTELSAVKAGMTYTAVRTLLGAPPTGWNRSSEDGRYESWFYRNADGGTAAVHFDHGKVIGIDYSGGEAGR